MSHSFVPVKTAHITWQNFCALSEIHKARHVFVEGNQLISRWTADSKNGPLRFNIGEIGFGAGINFLLTWQLWELYAPPDAQLHVIASESHPLTLNDLKRTLKLCPELEKYATQLVNQYPILTPGYHHLSFQNGSVHLTLMLGDVIESWESLLICGDSLLESELRTSFIDAWYLNHSDNKEGNDSLPKIMALLSKNGTTIAPNMNTKGFKVVCNATLQGYYEQQTPWKMKKRHTPWHIAKPHSPKRKAAIIVGAGLAGAITANNLAKRGWDVSVFDECNAPASGGSANTQAILFPKLSAFKSPLTELMLYAFIYATTFYKHLLSEEALGSLKGILLLAYNEKEQKIQQRLQPWLQHYPELGQLVDSLCASNIAKVPVNNPGLFIPESGWINMPLACNTLLKHEKISLISGHFVEALHYEGEEWTIQNTSAPVLILANGPQITQFNETKHLPVKPVRGQMTMVDSSIKSRQLSLPICAQGHALPEYQGLHHLGASYDPDSIHPTIDLEDDKENIRKFNLMTDSGLTIQDLKGNWSGIRATTPDYIPIVGPAPKADKIALYFSELKTDSNRWIGIPGSYYPGLYVCTGFGSRGLTTIPLCAHLLAALINNEIPALPRRLIQALSPARFLRRDMIRGTSKF